MSRDIFTYVKAYVSLKWSVVTLLRGSVPQDCSYTACYIDPALQAAE